MTDSNKAILEAANLAVGKGDYEGFLASCTDDTEWVFVGDRTLKGKESVRRWFAETYAQPPDNRVDRMIAEGDYVTAMGEITVVDKNGNATRSGYCDVWRFRDGLMAELRAFVVELP